MYINFQQTRVSRSVQTVHTNIFANNRKLDKFATTNSNLILLGLARLHAIVIIDVFITSIHGILTYW